MSEQQWIEAQALILAMLHAAQYREVFSEWFDLASECWAMQQAMEAGVIVSSPPRY